MIPPPHRRFLDAGAALRALFGPPTVDANDLAAHAREHLGALEELGLHGPTLEAVRRLGADTAESMRGGPLFRAIVGHYLRQLRELGVIAHAHDEAPEVTLERVMAMVAEDPTLTHERVRRVRQSKTSRGFEPSVDSSNLVRRARESAPPPKRAPLDEAMPSDSAMRSTMADPQTLGRISVPSARPRRLIVLEPAAEGDALLRVKSNFRVEVAAIGAGGSARVFRAHDVDTKRQVAIKIVTIPDESKRAMFLDLFHNERRLQGALAADGIVQIHKTGLTADGHPYLVMELLSGGSLGDYVMAVEQGQRRFQLEETLRIAAMAISALAVVHRAGVIHKDVKPDNFLFTEDHRQLKLGDFGVAQRKEKVSHDVNGTLGFIPQEAFEAFPDDETRDVFAMGVTLYFLLTGALPFDDESPSIAYKSVKSGVVRPPSECRPERAIPPAIDRVVMTAIARDRGDRHADADGLLADFVTADVRAFIDEASADRDDATPQTDDERRSIDARWVEKMRAAMRRLERIAEAFPSERIRRFRVELGATLLQHADGCGDQSLFLETRELLYDLEPRDDRLAVVSEAVTATFSFDDPGHLLRHAKLTYLMADFEDRGGVLTLAHVDSSPHFVRTLEYERGRTLGIGIEGRGIAPVFVPLPVRPGAHRIRIPIYDEAEVPEGATIVPAGFSAAYSRRGSYLADVAPDDLVAVPHDFALGNLVTTRDYLAFLSAFDRTERTGVVPEPVRAARARARFLDPSERALLEPVRGVLFDDAMTYLGWLGSGGGRGDRALEGVRLPMVHELKRACRGNDARAFPWGDAMARNASIAAFQYAGFTGKARPMESVPVDRVLGDRSPFSVPTTRLSFRRAAYHLVGNVTEMLSSGGSPSERAAVLVQLPGLEELDDGNDPLRSRHFLTFGTSFDRSAPTTADIVGVEPVKAPGERTSGRQLAYGFRWVKPLRRVDLSDG